jgi:dihydropteroate synthase
MLFRFKGRSLDCSKKKTFLMGILNVTPDSFSDGGAFFSPSCAIKHGVEMIDCGADIIDIGGESTRPGAEELTFDEEVSRVLPVIQGIKSHRPEAIISIDTRKPNVANVAIKAGADIINDISGLAYSEEIADIAARTGAGLILMHMRGNPQTMLEPTNLEYNSLIDEVKGALMNSVAIAMEAGVSREQIVLDPGVGFSKNCGQNIELLHNISSFNEFGYPILVGHSRKSFIGQVLSEPEPSKRVAGTLGVSAWLLSQDVNFLRVHDLVETKQLVTMFNKCRFLND